MGLMIVPIKNEKLSDWKNWTQKLNGEKSSEFNNLNKLHALTRHSVRVEESVEDIHGMKLDQSPPGLVPQKMI